MAKFIPVAHFLVIAHLTAIIGSKIIFFEPIINKNK